MNNRTIDVRSYLESPTCHSNKKIFNYLNDKILTINQNLEIASYADRLDDQEQAIYYLEKAYRIHRNQRQTTQKLVEKYCQTGRLESAKMLLENGKRRKTLSREIVENITESYPEIKQTNKGLPNKNQKTLLITDAFYPQISPSNSILNWQIAKKLIVNNEIAILCMDIPQFSQYPERIIPDLEQKVYRTLPYPFFSNKNPNKSVDFNHQIINTINEFIRFFSPENILIIPNFMETDPIEDKLAMQSIKYQTIIDAISINRHQNIISQNKPNRKYTSPSNGVDPYPLLPTHETPCLLAYSENYSPNHIQTILRTVIRIIKEIGICYCTIFEDINKGNLKETVTEFQLEKNLKFLKRNKDNFNEVMASHNIFIDLGSSPTHLLEAFQNDLIIFSSDSFLQKINLPYLNSEINVDNLSEKILSLFENQSKALKHRQEQQKIITHKKVDLFK